jgi:hypothetical protein
LLTAGLLLATLVSPFGYKNWLNVWNYAQFGRALSDLNHELFMPPLWPLHWATSVFWLAWLATVALALRGFFKKSDRALAVLAAAGLFLSAQAVRNMPFLFLFSPLLWRGVEYQWRSARLNMASGALAAVSALVLSGSVVLGYYHGWAGALSRFGVKLESASYPITAAQFLKDRYFRGKIFCDSYDGGYLEFHLPGVEVAGDSYFADAAQTRRFFAAIKDPVALLQLNNQFRFDALLVNVENAEVFNVLIAHPEWVVAFADSHRALFVTRSANPHLDGDLSKFTFYQGESLRHWTYEFGVVSWMALAYQNKQPALMRKIVQDIGRADYIPQMPFQVALKFASETRDEELLKLLAAAKSKTE